MNKTRFKAVFDECMKTDLAVGCQVDSYTGKVYHYDVKIEPKMVIRDFSVEMPSLNDENFNSTFDLSNCDKEFTDFDKAWDFYKENFPHIRVMDNAGRIFFDYYTFKEKGGELPTGDN